MCGLLAYAKSPSRQLCLIAALLAGSLSGCSDPVPPEQAAAIAKYQALGGKVLFSNGGYQLELSGTQISNDDLADLKDIAKLRGVELRDTRITDEGLKHLEGLTNLKHVDLQRTPVSRAAIDALKKALPETQVKF